MPGVPASETRATSRPARSASRMRSPFQRSLCSKYDVVGVEIPCARQQARGAARVLAGDERDLAQDAHRAQGDVLEVAERRGDDVERPCGLRPSSMRGPIASGILPQSRWRNHWTSSRCDLMRRQGAVTTRP